ncbi:MAG: DUF1611 domain-containing protein [Alphaproteobacteria bacterium]|nr:DUF1611 domain-containing protein [Alphaproteobacteria bacterium]
MEKKIQHPYLMFLGDVADQLSAKTAQGIVDWRPEWCLGKLRLPHCKADLPLPEMTLDQALDAGVKTVIIGVANRGGVFSPHWIPVLLQALEKGFDLASGLHQKLTDYPELKLASERYGRKLFDVRHPNQDFNVGTGKKRTGKRLLTVGSDCSIGKMYTALACEKEMKLRGIHVDFRATGQTGIFIAGSGVSIDAVVADFISGAVEHITPDNNPNHWDIIEGQGSLFHPSYAGVSLGLLHGAQADMLVMCHDPSRPHMRGLPHYSLPDLDRCIEANLNAGSLTNSSVRCVGLSLNTSTYSVDEAQNVIAEYKNRYKLPVVDPVRTGVSVLVDAILA